MKGYNVELIKKMKLKYFLSLNPAYTADLYYELTGFKRPVKSAKNTTEEEEK